MMNSEQNIEELLGSIETPQQKKDLWYYFCYYFYCLCICKS